MNVAGGGQDYDVGVAITPLAGASQGDRGGTAGVPGYEQLIGGRRTAILIERGEHAVAAATDALAGQIAVSASRIAHAIGDKLTQDPPPSSMELEAIQICFGVTFGVGVQAMFTAQADSSAQVTITLRAQPAETTVSAGS